jgi:O-methyltransferase involved in polyketide biosynthesis
MHANIELRTVYLNQAMQSEIDRIVARGDATAIELVILGGGYDTRAIRTMMQYPEVERAWELDLKNVVASKEKLLYQMYKQLPELASRDLSLRLLAVDLNNLEQVYAALEQISLAQKKKTHIIIITEAVLMYLDDGIPIKILDICREKFQPNLSWLFVDNLKVVPSGRNDILSASKLAASNYFSTKGWHVVEWLIKPGATRHMGILRPDAL